jgi:hypothetical protein
MPSRIPKDVTHILLANNPISSFRGLRTLPNLVELSLDSTQISTFEGAAPQPSLRRITFYNTPLTERKEHRLMAGIVFHPSLKTVNNVDLTPSELKLIAAARDEVWGDLVAGWLIVARNPLKLINPATRERRLVYLQTSSSSRRESPTSYGEFQVSRVATSTSRTLKSAISSKKIDEYQPISDLPAEPIAGDDGYDDEEEAKAEAAHPAPQSPLGDADEEEDEPEPASPPAQKVDDNGGYDDEEEEKGPAAPAGENPPADGEDDGYDDDDPPAAAAGGTKDAAPAAKASAGQDDGYEDDPPDDPPDAAGDESDGE